MSERIEKRELDIRALQQSGMTREASERVVARIEADRDKAATNRRLEADSPDLIAQIAVLSEALQLLWDHNGQTTDEYNAKLSAVDFDKKWGKQPHIAVRVESALSDLPAAATALLDRLAQAEAKLKGWEQAYTEESWARKTKESTERAAMYKALWEKEAQMKMGAVEDLEQAEAREKRLVGVLKNAAADPYAPSWARALLAEIEAVASRNAGRRQVNDMVYVGREPDCGHIVAVVVDEPAYAKSTAKDVAVFIKDGLHVSREKLEVFKAEGFCKCGRNDMNERSEG